MLDELINENKNLIYSIIKKYTYYCDKEDLYQTAVIGLIKAYQNYNTNYNTKFSTYAYPYILSEVLLYINSSKAIKLGRAYQRNYKKIINTKIKLSQRLMREPTLDELSFYLELDKKVINDIIMLTTKLTYLDEEIKKDGSNLCLIDTITNDTKDKIIDDLIFKSELEKLNSKEKELIYKRYYKDESQQEIAHELNTNQVNISRQEKKVLQKLKRNLIPN